MARPMKRRCISFEPGAVYFKPRGVPMSELEEVQLGIDEAEALRLSDLEQLSQAEAAETMGIHQSTFQRMLARARQKVSDALVNGKAIRLGGKNENRDSGRKRHGHGHSG